MSVRLALLLLLLMLPFHVSLGADLPLSMTGHVEQGGLLRGIAPVGSRLELSGKEVRLAENGAFIIGFSRKAPPTATLTAYFPDGTKESWTLDVAQRHYDIQHIDGLPDNQVSPDPASLSRIKDDQTRIRGARRGDPSVPLFEEGFIWPVTGPITGVYGSQRILNGAPRSPHLGVDIAANLGTPIFAPASGRVVLVEDDMFFTGKTIMLDHGLGLTSVYAHMDSIGVKDGQWVEQGTMIGRVGKTGRVTGAHLHWGVHLFATGLDPAFRAGVMPK